MVAHQRIAVLGGGGFLGSHLVERLLEAEDSTHVHAVDLTFDKLEAESPRLIKTQSSIEDEALVDRIVEDADLVISTTALCNPSLYNTRPLEVIAANFSDLMPVVRLCSKHGRRLIHFSTCEVYGRSGPSSADPAISEVLHEDHSPLVLGPVAAERWTYACAKQLLERVIWAHGQHGALEFTIVRPFNVIGPRMDYLPGIDGEGTPRVLACFMKSLLHREPLALVEGGHQRRSFLYVEDFVDAVMRIVERPEACRQQIFNLGHPENDVSIAELARLMVAAYREVTHDTHNHVLERVSAEDFYGPGYDDTEARIPDIGKACRVLEWHPSYSLEQMLPLIVRDYVLRYGQQREHLAAQ